MSIIQIETPEAIYGRPEYFSPEKIENWCFDLGLEWSLCIIGNSDEHGRRIGYYFIYDGSDVDAIDFKLRYPECKVYFFS